MPPLDLLPRALTTLDLTGNQVCFFWGGGVLAVAFFFLSLSVGRATFRTPTPLLSGVVAANQIVELPANLGTLRNLETLDLSENR